MLHAHQALRRHEFRAREVSHLQCLSLAPCFVPNCHKYVPRLFIVDRCLPNLNRVRCAYKRSRLTHILITNSKRTTMRFTLSTIALLFSAIGISVQAQSCVISLDCPKGCPGGQFRCDLPYCDNGWCRSPTCIPRGSGYGCP